MKSGSVDDSVTPSVTFLVPALELLLNTLGTLPIDEPALLAS